MGKKVSISKLCRGCMNPIDNAASICPICGFDVEMYNVKKNELRLNFILISRYMIGKVVAESDNEITYIGWDLAVDRRVIIKEYYPKGLVSRNKTDEGRVSLVDSSTEDIFYERKKSYMKVSGDMMNLRNNPGMIKVMDVFETNNTVYQVVLCPVGHRVSNVVLKYNGMIPANHVGRIITTVADNLCVMHNNGLLCDIISIDNILVTNEYSVEMLDYNTASNFLKYNNAGVKSDIYDVCVAAYIMLSDRFLNKGEIVALRERIASAKDIKRPSEFGIVVSDEFEEVLMKGLGFEYNSSEEFCEELMSIKDFENGGKTKKQKNSSVMICEDRVCNVQEGRQVDMRDDRYEQNNMTDTGVLNGQPQINNKQRSMKVGNVGTNARLNSALRAKKYGTGADPFANAGYANTDSPVDRPMSRYENADRMNGNGSSSRGNYYSGVDNFSNTSMNDRNQKGALAYPVSDEWNENDNVHMKKSYGGVAQSKNSSYQALSMQNDYSQNGVRRENGDGAFSRPQRPEVPVMTRSNYPMNYSNSEVAIRNSVSASRTGMGKSALSSNDDELKQRGSKISYDIMPLNTESSSDRKNGRKTFLSIVACSLLVGLAVFMVVRSLIGTKSDTMNAQDEKKASSTQQSNTQKERNDGNNKYPIQKLDDGTQYYVMDVQLKSEVVKNFLKRKFQEMNVTVDMNKLTTTDLKNISEIDLHGEQMDTLDDFRFFPALQKLSLNDCGLTDEIMNTMPETKRLVCIDISNNQQVTNISILQRCMMLTEIYARNTGVTSEMVASYENLAKGNVKIEVQ